MKKTLVLLLILFSQKSGFCQAPFTSYTFQVNNTCTPCCTASTCISFTLFCPTEPFNYALITPTTSFPVYGINPCFNNLCNGSYTINVQGLSSSSCALCDISTSFNNPSTSIDVIELNEDKLFNIFPNPAKNYFKINWPTLPNNLYETIEIFDTYGKRLKNYNISQGTNETEYLITDLDQGIYFVVLSNKGLVLSRKRLFILK